MLKPVHLLGIVSAAAIVVSPTWAQTLPDSLRARVDGAAATILQESGSPSIAIAIVRDGAVVYENAYGEARTGTPATASMRYGIGSVSKQFVAAAVLLLAEEKKLSLNDKVSKWMPELTRAKEISIRQLLSMTAGYQDYWPQDYVLPAVRTPTTPREILAQWAKKPLDFDPGTQFQYSNTNYTIAGLIVEEISGMPLMDFLQQRIFTPLRMTSVKDLDAGPLDDDDAGPYLRNALGPLRPAPKEAKGWLFAAGNLAMTAHDLALWNISLMSRSLLKRASHDAMFKEVSAGYGLGVFVRTAGGRRRIEHDGGVSGYSSKNVIYPDDRIAVVALANIYPGAASNLADAIARILLDDPPAGDAPTLDLAQRVFLALQQGQIDRTLFTSNANAYFDAETLADFSSSLRPLGAPIAFTEEWVTARGGMTFRGYRVVCGGTALSVTIATLPDGKIEQYVVSKS